MFWKNIRFVCRHYFRSSRSLFGYMLLGMTASLLVPVFSVYLPRVVVQAVTEGWEFKILVFRVAVLAAGIAVLNSLIVVGNAGYAEKAATGRIKLGLRLDEMMMRCRYSLTEDPVWKQKTGAAADAVYSDGRTYGIAGIIHTMQDFVINILGIVLFFGILGTLHPMVLGILIFTAVLPNIVANRVAAYEFRQREKVYPSDRQIEYIYNHVTTGKAGKEIRLCKAAGFFLRRMEEAVAERMVWARKAAVRHLGVEGVNALMLVFQNGVSLGWIAWEILEGRISLADFAFYTGAVAQFVQFMNRFMQSFHIMKQCSYDVQMVREALAYMPEEWEEPEEMPEDCRGVEIRFDHVSFSYPGSEEAVLEDISFHVRPGEKISLVGANGAGKTTLVKLLCGFYEPTAGSITIDGIPISKMREGKLYGLISAVFQDMLVLPFSVLDNVAVRGTADVDKVRLCLEKAGLSSRFPNLNQPLVKGVGEGAENLSGGEEQKLLLARALYKESPLLILDEPTAALDPLAESELYKKYHQLTRKKTSFFISHRLASTGFCDRILLLEDGRIKEEGTHRELLEKGGVYAGMFREQSKYYKEGAETTGWMPDRGEGGYEAG